MKALLLKDCRINRMVLIVGLLLLVTPLFVGALVNLYGLVHYGALARPWPNLIAWTGVVSLALSLLTFGMLGGNAVAGERMDRSAEFLAYLPPSRGKVIASKAILAIGVGVLVWLVNFVLIYYLAPLVGEVTQDVINVRDQAIPLFATTSLFLFGVAWLGSTFLDSPAIATGLGFGAPWVVFAVLSLFLYGFGYEDLDMALWYHTLAVAFGAACFVGGIVYYVRRVEP